MTYEKAVRTCELMETKAKEIRGDNPNPMEIGASYDQAWYAMMHGFAPIFISGMTVESDGLAFRYRIANAFLDRQQFIAVLTTHFETAYSRKVQ